MNSSVITSVITITVTEEIVLRSLQLLIQENGPSRPCCCPLALAFARALRRKIGQVIVARGYLRVDGRVVIHDGFPDSLREFMEAFDRVIPPLIHGRRDRITDAERAAALALVPFAFSFDTTGIRIPAPAARQEVTT